MHQIGFSKSELGEGEITLEDFQKKLVPRLAEASFYQTRTTALGYEGDLFILQADRYSKDGKLFESAYVLGATIDDMIVELWEWARDHTKTDAEVKPLQRLAPGAAATGKDSWASRGSTTGCCKAFSLMSACASHR